MLAVVTTTAGKETAAQKWVLWPWLLVTGPNPHRLKALTVNKTGISANVGYIYRVVQKCPNLFLSELRQIFIKVANFWHTASQYLCEPKIMW